MIRSIALLLALVLAPMWGVAQEPTNDIAFSTNVIDLGTLSRKDARQVVEVEYTNVGDKPLVLLEVRTSCSCTHIKYDRRKLMPGEKASMTITMDPSKAPEGSFYRVLQVTSTAPGVRNITLKAQII